MDTGLASVSFSDNLLGLGAMVQENKKDIQCLHLDIIRLEFNLHTCIRILFNYNANIYIIQTNNVFQLSHKNGKFNMSTTHQGKIIQKQCCVNYCRQLLTLRPRRSWYTRNCTWSSVNFWVLTMLLRSAPIRCVTRYLDNQHSLNGNVTIWWQT